MTVWHVPKYDGPISSSTHNTRIERLWVEVGTQFARRWRAFFTRLERLYHLDVTNPGHLWLLDILFLDQLNEDCDAFVLDWNQHGISGSETRNQAPVVSQVSHRKTAKLTNCV